MKKIFFGILVFLSCLAGSVTASTIFTGTVVAVDDGDTVIVQGLSGEIKKIRFYGVDTPESEWEGRWPEQPYSQEAKSFVTKYLLNKEVRVHLTGDVTYSREVGEVFYKDASASKELVRRGLAWWNSKYAAGDIGLKRLENTARKQKHGLWLDAKPTPPWEWRRRYK
jgi:micrococcal nuclease